MSKNIPAERFDTIERRWIDPDYEPAREWTHYQADAPEHACEQTPTIVWILAVLCVLILLAWVGSWR